MDGGIVMATDALANLAMNEAMDAQIDAAKQAGHVEMVEAPQDADLETFCAGLGLVVPTGQVPFNAGDQNPRRRCANDPRTD